MRPSLVATLSLLALVNTESPPYQGHGEGQVYISDRFPSGLRPSQCRTVYTCSDDSGRVKVPKGPGGGDHVEESCLEAESVVNPDGSWGGSKCTNKLKQWVEGDNDPNYVWACPCPPGAKRERMPVVGGNRNTCSYPPSSSTSTASNTAASEHYKSLCPRAHGTRETINGVEYEYACQSTLASCTESRVVKGVCHSRVCASLCSDDLSCQGAVFNSDMGTCHFTSEVGSNPVTGGTGSLVLKPTSPRKDADDRQRKEKEERERREREERERRDREEKDRRERDEKDRREREEKERREREEKDRKDREEKDRERDRKDREERDRKDREEKDRKDREERDREREREDRDRREREERDRERERRDKEEAERREKEERDRRERDRERDREELERKERERREREERERREKEERDRLSPGYASESEMETYKSAHYTTFCNNGPNWDDAYDKPENPKRKLIKINGEIFILYCNTRTHAHYKAVQASGPWECASQCAKDPYCFGSYWYTGHKHCYYGQRTGDPLFWAQVGWHALMKKSVDGQITTCIRQKPVGVAGHPHHAFTPCTN